MSQSDYVTACCLGKRIVILDGLKGSPAAAESHRQQPQPADCAGEHGESPVRQFGFCCAGVRKINTSLRELQEGGAGKIAIVHFVNYKKGTQTRGCMKSVMRYVSKLSKTLWDGQQLVSGIGCQPETAFDEFLSTKLLHHKDGGVMFYHMVQSFPKGADIDPRTAHEAARQLAGYFEGCEVLVCTHVDREHIHSHLHHQQRQF